jgi:hypothetical protein
VDDECRICHGKVPVMIGAVMEPEHDRFRVWGISVATKTKDEFEVCSLAYKVVSVYLRPCICTS